MAHVTAVALFFVAPLSFILTAAQSKYRVTIQYAFVILIGLLMALGVKPEFYNAEEGNMLYWIMLTISLINIAGCSTKAKRFTICCSSQQA